MGVSNKLKKIDRKLYFNEDGEFIGLQRSNIAPKSRSTKAIQEMNLIKFYSLGIDKILEMEQDRPEEFQGIIFDAIYHKLKDEESRVEFYNSLCRMATRLVEKITLEAAKSSTQEDAEDESVQVIPVIGSYTQLPEGYVFEDE